MSNQTPRQRAANAKFNKKLEKRMGKPKSQFQKAAEPPISKKWIYFIFFLMCGGAVLELIRFFF